MRYPCDLSGQTIGDWEVLGLHRFQYNIGMWECRCTKCGAIEIIPRKRIVRYQKRCDACSSNIDVKAYTEYLQSRRYSNTEKYVRVINSILDHYSEAELLAAYNAGTLHTLTKVVPKKAPHCTKKVTMREIGVYCNYVQNVRVPQEEQTRRI